MARGEKVSAGAMRRWRRVILAVASIGAMILLSASTAGADGPFEPNNDVNEAAGPIIGGQPLQAGFESDNDKDVYFFYVGAAADADAELTVENLGGGTNPYAQMEARVIDSSRNYVGGNFAYIRPGEARAESFTVQPGKYFVEVLPVGGGGGSYQLLPGSGDGVFIEYAPIASRCAAASAKVTTLRAQLGRLNTKLQRAISRLRRSTYSDQKVRTQARSHYLTLKARVRAKRRAVRIAARAKSPWCLIPA